jgi:hypothetical protein
MNGGVIYGDGTKDDVAEPLRNTAASGAAYYKSGGTSGYETTSDTIRLVDIE